MATGDVVNTAARLQAAAPVNGVLTDETTYRATRGRIDLREAGFVEAKGKAEPIPIWEAFEARSRFGVDVTHHARADLVGRERELSVLRDALDRVRQERIPQLITLVAVPGMGKSRLVHELSRIVDADPELITWRQGRCVAYGDGVAFWALAEIVKAQAGILERDAEAEVAEKLHAAVVEAVDDASDARWVESHLRPLVGLESETVLGADLGDRGRAAGGPDPDRRGIVHRLDRDTSGLLVLAKSDAAHAELQRSEHAHELRSRRVRERVVRLHADHDELPERMQKWWVYEQSLCGRHLRRATRRHVSRCDHPAQLRVGRHVHQRHV